MSDRVVRDSCDVRVGQRVNHFSAATPAADETLPAQDPEMLRDEGLGQAKGVDEVVNTLLTLAELSDDREAARIAKSAQECHGLVEAGSR